FESVTAIYVSFVGINCGTGQKPCRVHVAMQFLPSRTRSSLSLSFSGLTGESSAGDYQDCGMSTMLLMGEPCMVGPERPSLPTAASQDSAVIHYEEKKKKAQESAIDPSRRRKFPTQAPRHQPPTSRAEPQGSFYPTKLHLLSTKTTVVEPPSLSGRGHHVGANSKPLLEDDDRPGVPTTPVSNPVSFVVMAEAFLDLTNQVQALAGMVQTIVPYLPQLIQSVTPQSAPLATPPLDGVTCDPKSGKFNSRSMYYNVGPQKFTRIPRLLYLLGHEESVVDPSRRREFPTQAPRHQPPTSRAEPQGSFYPTELHLLSTKTTAGELAHTGQN
ncbi:hypothetical protein BHE74_00011927, partial [Ensete ventricosum]